MSEDEIEVKEGDIVEVAIDVKVDELDNTDEFKNGMYVLAIAGEDPKFEVEHLKVRVTEIKENGMVEGELTEESTALIKPNQKNNKSMKIIFHKDNIKKV